MVNTDSEKPIALLNGFSDFVPNPRSACRLRANHQDYRHGGIFKMPINHSLDTFVSRLFGFRVLRMIEETGDI
jgi:hypothetical protein